MTFSTGWQAAYAAGKQHSAWPWSDLVSAVKRHCPNLKDKRVLELGCGVGANIGFFIAMNARYTGIEGSITAASEAMSRWPSVPISVGDFTQLLPYQNIDLVVDRSSITHNEVASIERCLDLVYEALRPGGMLISIDWFSTLHGDPAQFDGLGHVHRADEEELRSLLYPLEIVSLEEKVVRRVTPQRGDFASWNVVCRKPT